jgi:hypothetical protein
VVLLLEGAVVSWPLAMDKRGGHEDLRGLGRRSVIPYAHERTELYCSSLSCLSLPFLSVGLDRLIFSTPVKMCLPGPFIAQGRVVTMSLGGRQVASRWLKWWRIRPKWWRSTKNGSRNRYCFDDCGGLRF